ncbi:hypothetical protein [Sutterella wadsworthensis]|uniref:hypothetical protein n=1 Tax=Sutterella wadsworthensis TaxID=40545 RepID=UPI00266C76A4|nr:hypothetical protein [Sutterella wadsworthensis]
MLLGIEVLREDGAGLRNTAQKTYKRTIAKGSERRIPMALCERPGMRRRIMPTERFKAGGEDVRRQLEANYF